MIATSFTDRRRFPVSPGFTLLEMLAVMAITAILLTLALPGLRDLLSSFMLDGCGESVSAQLALAQQTAVTRNHAVQVRLYKLPDYGVAVSGIPSVYRALQSFLEDDSSGTGLLTPLSKAAYFPAPILISSNTTLSTLLAQAASGPSSDAKPVALGGYGTNYQFISLRFTPDGKLDTTSFGNTVLSGDNYCLTLEIEHGKTNAVTQLPANFVTLQMDPLTGAVRKYRP